MTKERKADLLLEAARCWQCESLCFFSGTLNPPVWTILRTTDGWEDVSWKGETEIAASACLSEVCHGLGFEIEDAP